MSDVSQPLSQPKPKLLERVRHAIRTRHYSASRNLGAHAAATLRSRGRLPHLHEAGKRGALPAGPTERGGPPPLSNFPHGLCVPSWTAPVFCSAQSSRRTEDAYVARIKCFTFSPCCRHHLHESVVQARSRRPSAGRASPSQPPATPSDTCSPRISSRTATISARFGSSWAIRM